MILTFGLVVEGLYDAAVLPELIRKCISSTSQFYPRPCGPKGKFLTKFPSYLEEFRYKVVDRALVVRDTDGKDPDQLEQKLQDRIQGRIYNFPVKFHAISQELETWLLADERAISVVTQARSGRVVTRTQETLELIQDPKEMLQRILGNAGIAYTPEVARMIAMNSNIETIQLRCPRFNRFCALLTE